MPLLTLCCFPGACSRATMIALEETGAAYDVRVANLPKGEQRAPDYLAINPKGKVPVLVIDGKPLTENAAILTWLADTYPEAKLLPPDPLQRAQALSAVSWWASAVLPAFGRMVRPERVSDQPSSAESIRAKALDEVRDNLAIAETQLDGRPWWVETFSIADPYLYYIFCNATGRFALDPAPFPGLAAHRARMEARPAVQRMTAWEEKARAALAA